MDEPLGQCGRDLMPVGFPSSAWKRDFRRRLNRWFGKNARELPWRATSDPYLVWVSEIMLQQTQVRTVIPYYERFVEQFPRPSLLAEAAEDDVLRRWEGLGYYRRARQMHKAAKQIVALHGGDFPTDFDSVLALPGVGRYTAGAVLSIALDSRLPIVEANTIRLYSRLLEHRGDVALTASQNRFWEFAESILPRKGCGQFNQALMELGAEICKPKAPICESCPVRMQCPTFAQGMQSEIPAPKRKVAFEDRREAALVIWRDNRILVRRCGDSERWAGLWDFPRFPVAREVGEVTRSQLVNGAKQLMKLRIKPGARILRLRHGVTRYRISLECYEAELVGEEQRTLREDKAIRWLSIDELADTPLNTTGRQLARHISANRIVAEEK